MDEIVLPLVRTHASIIAGSAPNAAMTLTGIPSYPRSGLTNEEWRINAQLRLGIPRAGYHNQPHAPCPHGCKHPQTKKPADQEARSCAVRIPPCHQGKPGQKVANGRRGRGNDHPPLQHLHEHHGDQGQSPSRTASEQTSSSLAFPPSRQPGGPKLASRRHVWVTNQDFINRAALGHQPGPEAQRNTIPATTSSPAQSAQRSANTPSMTPSARQRGLSSHLSRSRTVHGSTGRAIRTSDGLPVTTHA
jgi:hypothetical protein